MEKINFERKDIATCKNSNRWNIQSVILQFLEEKYCCNYLKVVEKIRVFELPHAGCLFRVLANLHFAHIELSICGSELKLQPITIA